MPVDAELPGWHLHHAAQGAGQGCFAAAHRANNGHQFPWLDLEADAVEGITAAVRVADVQVMGLDGSRLADLAQLFGLGWRLDGWLAPEQLFHPLEADLPGLEGTQGETKQGRWEHQALHIKDQCHKAAKREVAVGQLAGAQAQQHQER